MKRRPFAAARLKLGPHVDRDAQPVEQRTKPAVSAGDDPDPIGRDARSAEPFERKHERLRRPFDSGEIVRRDENSRGEPRPARRLRLLERKAATEPSLAEEAARARLQAL